MNTLQWSLRRTLVWLAPFAMLALLLMWQTDWGRAFARSPASAETTPAPQPLTLALLPEYRPAAINPGGNDAIERTLFNPTRRPAPSPAATEAKPKIQRGQFALSGTLMVDGKAIAYLREVQGGKSRRVMQGETVNGMVVSEVRPDRVRLSVGEESEDLTLKVAAGPKTTIQPVMPVVGSGPVTASAAPAPGATPNQPPIPQARDVSEVLAERRRAARAAEAAAQGLPPGSPNPALAGSAPVTAPNMPPPPTVNPNAGDPQWQSVYQRYQQPRR
jgi:hypothetical protein